MMLAMTVTENPFQTLLNCFYDQFLIIKIVHHVASLNLYGFVFQFLHLCCVFVCWTEELIIKVLSCCRYSQTEIDSLLNLELGNLKQLDPLCSFTLLSSSLQFVIHSSETSVSSQENQNQLKIATKMGFIYSPSPLLSLKNNHPHNKYVFSQNSIYFPQIILIMLDLLYFEQICYNRGKIYSTFKVVSLGS